MNTISHYSDLCVISYRKQLLCREQELKKKLQVSTSASSQTPLSTVPIPFPSRSSSSAGNPDAWVSQSDINPNACDLEQDDSLFVRPCQVMKKRKTAAYLPHLPHSRRQPGSGAPHTTLNSQCTSAYLRSASGGDSTKPSIERLNPTHSPQAYVPRSSSW